MKIASILILTITIITGCSISPSESEMDKLQDINRKLNIITSSPKAFSNPYKYVEEHRNEFEFLVAQRDLTLNHFLNEFKVSENDGLKEFVMAIVCVEILAEKNPVEDWESGRAWYNSYQKAKSK